MKRNKQKPSISSPEFRGNINIKSYEPREAGLESLLPILGYAQDINDILRHLNNQDYKSAILTTSLLAVPNVVEKPLKYATKATMKWFKSPSKKITKAITEGDVIESVDKAVNNFTGNKSLNNLMEPSGKININNDVQKRYDYLNITPKGSYVENLESNIPVYLRNPDNAELKLIRGNDKLSELSKFVLNLELKKHPEYLAGYDKRNKVFVFNSNLSKNSSNNNLDGVVSHEVVHAMQDLLNADLNSPNIRSRINDILSPHTVENTMSIRRTGEWGGLNELQSDIWNFRSKKGIGSRDLNNEEVLEFIKSPEGSRHFNQSASINPKKNLVKIIPGLSGTIIGTDILKAKLNGDNQK